MKKLFALFLTVCLVLSALCLPAAAEETWVEVSTWGELYAALSKDLAAKIKLTDDISIKDEDSALKDADEVKLYANRSLISATAADGDKASATGWKFSGVLDGAGHSINLENVPIHFKRQGGFFHSLAGATIQNLTLMGVNYQTVDCDGGVYSGVFSSTCGEGGATFSNVHVQASYEWVSGKANVCYFGGFIGALTASGNEINITGCSINLSATNPNTEKETKIGGFIGTDRNGATVNITNSFAVGSISASTSAGGMLGGIGAGNITAENPVLSLTNCISLVNVTADLTGQYAAGVTPTIKFEGFDVLSGARIRLASGENAEKNSGIRFDVAVNADLLATIQKSGAVVDLGTLVWATDAEPSYEFTAEAMKAAGKKYSEVSVAATDASLRENKSESEAYYGYTAALINITDYTQAYSCRAFMDITIGDTTVRIYSDYAAADNSRSLQILATRALGDETQDYSAYEELLKTFAGIQ